MKSKAQIKKELDLKMQILRCSTYIDPILNGFIEALEWVLDL